MVGLLALALVCPLALTVGEGGVDPFDQLLLFGWRGEDGALLRVFRSIRAQELPFHVIPDETKLPMFSKLLEGIRRTKGPFSYLAADHGGYLIKAKRPGIPLVSNWLLVPGGTDEGKSGYRIIDLQNLDYSKEIVDPYTGNIFKGDLVGGERIGDPGVRLKLTVSSKNQEKLIQVTGGLLVGDPSELPKIDFLDEEKLDSVALSYARLSEQAYADFLMDNYLLSLDMPEESLRLPFLPTAKLVRELVDHEAVDNLRSLTMPIYQGKKEMLWHRLLGIERGSPVCAVIPILKILEDRRCRQTHGADCPAYSVMGVYTELLRKYGGSDGPRKRGFRFDEVIDVIQERGLCQERHYPFLLKAAKDNKRDHKKLAKDAERQLNQVIKSLKKGGAPAPEYAAFMETLGQKNGKLTRGIKFDDQSLPPLCTAEMSRFRQEEPVHSDEFVVLYFLERFGGEDAEYGLEADISVSDLLGGKDDAEELVAAQRRELYLITLALLERGELVAVGGDRGKIKRHGVLAYGVEPAREGHDGGGGIIYLESSTKGRDGRLGNVLQGDDASRVIKMIAFLRQ